MTLTCGSDNQRVSAEKLEQVQDHEHRGAGRGRTAVPGREQDSIQWGQPVGPGQMLRLGNRLSDVLVKGVSFPEMTVSLGLETAEGIHSSPTAPASALLP